MPETCGADAPHVFLSKIIKHPAPPSSTIITTIMTDKLHLIICLLLPFLNCTAGNRISYTPQDSITITRMLSDAMKQNPHDRVIHFARRFLGQPYVAKTLERNKTERLVVNCRELDCTTFLETVLSMELCMRQKAPTFKAFTRNLTSIRYFNDDIKYATRKHYFSSWIADNSEKGIIEEINLNHVSGGKTKGHIAYKTLSINYMSANKDKYPMIAQEKGSIADIRKIERQLTGMKTAYIPKADLKNTPSNNEYLKECIHDGDIIAIVTSIPGLDVSHVGFAVWHNDTLHLINASQVHKKVVEEPMTLYDYMQRHPKQKGIRIIRIK
ncbi:MAG: N-acetylmuramoyl-L-alanine amidase-like domain-containing protein [Prevotella sp.]